MSAGFGERDLARLVERLREIHERRARQTDGPGRERSPLPGSDTPYDRARAAFARRDRRLQDLADVGEAVAQEHLPPLGDGGPDAALVELLRRIQLQIFRHPLAFRAAFAALVAEGRRFATTPEGAAWRERLGGTPWVSSARLLLQTISFSMLDEEEPESLPSAYLEGLFRAASREDLDHVLDRLFGGPGDDEASR